MKILFLILLTSLLFSGCLNKDQNNDLSTSSPTPLAQELITSFDECTAAGFEIRESYPAVCVTPEGQSFVQDVSGTNNSETPAEDDPLAPGAPSSRGPASNDLSPTQTSSPTASPQTSNNMIILDQPTANSLITSPVTVTGRARGGWYFEADFPAEVRDATGKLLGQAPIQAQGEWMTENFVPFRGSVTFQRPTTATGTIVLRRSNPSGLPENDQSFSIPVRFQ